MPAAAPQTAPAREPPPRLVVRPMSGMYRALRVFAFFSAAVLLTGLVSMLFADLLWRTGWSASRTILLALFIILFFLAAVGCMHGVYGFLLRIFGDRHRITLSASNTMK